MAITSPVAAANPVRNAQPFPEGPVFGTDFAPPATAIAAVASVE